MYFYAEVCVVDVAVHIEHGVEDVCRAHPGDWLHVDFAVREGQPGRRVALAVAGKEARPVERPAVLDGVDHRDAPVAAYGRHILVAHFEHWLQVGAVAV